MVTIPINLVALVFIIGLMLGMWALHFLERKGLRKYLVEILASILLLSAIFGLGHQWFISGTWFSPEQFWHHEPLIALCLVAAVALLVGKYSQRLMNR